MLIKSADDRSEDIRALTALLEEPTLSPTQRHRIREQRDNLEKGAWGEQKAAYFIDFHFAGSKNNIILHDLKLVSPDGRVAQIDHVIINRMMFVYVLETKNWKQLTVDVTGICTIWAGRYIGVESPLEQCKRHAEVLSAVFKSNPVLSALAPRHEIISRVLLAPGCNLRAPHHKDWYLKADHFHAAWDKEFNDATFLKGVLGLSRLISTESLVKLGRELAGLHQPDRPDWRSRFGVSPLPLKVELPPNKVVASIEGLSDYVPEWGDDWFVLKAEPTEATKKKIKAAGYRARQQNGEWVWRLRRS